MPRKPDYVLDPKAPKEVLEAIDNLMDPHIRSWDQLDRMVGETTVGGWVQFAIDNFAVTEEVRTKYELLD